MQLTFLGTCAADVDREAIQAVCPELASTPICSTTPHCSTTTNSIDYGRRRRRTTYVLLLLLISRAARRRPLRTYVRTYVRYVRYGTVR